MPENDQKTKADSRTAQGNPWGACWRPSLQVFGEVSVWTVVPIVASLVAGRWLDARYGTKPWAFLSLTGIAFLVSCFGIIQTIRRYMQNLDKKDGTANEL